MATGRIVTLCEGSLLDTLSSTVLFVSTCVAQPAFWLMLCSPLLDVSASTDVEEGTALARALPEGNDLT